ncbi:YqaJ viral recombinase family protein [Pseudomonas fluorescens group sp.]|uniref:Phage-related protein n=2 Tax=Pseudomonas fluorescens TaxID=294 RepID=C3KA13_PSEFS|nr:MULTISPECIES: YqaJ viral recombinase family protein [Pseudomonas fluorescens group]MBZ6453877.1 YqaJ viral recombinase family protein [Pseudomonas fluorescens group sp.]MBZ6459863.1 YqaJ viral recombinase family protein [Pseudomonas fluorescens group sp.]MBZ6466754.1 YqaJ viral recombinase family protein [Pseudomonas fluorescens group sp.]WQD75040.1 YqaJ viral recombinase family protein [Pseudomonas marginalis]CAI2797059.1 Putative phage-related protein [Pseudomonas fluorescens SBW25]
MKIHNVAQGSAEWLALRAQYRTASEAPAMMGASKYQSRTDLLIAKKTGITPDATPSQQFVFDKGHATEALARPLTEALIGEELYPIVATEGNLLASMDGATMLGETLFEHKLWNESVVAQVKAGDLAPHYYWQLEQQLLVSGAERVIFVCSDGTPENFVHMEYRPVAGRAAQLLEGWKQFEADLANFEMADAPSIVVGKAPDELPALRIELTGMVTASNLKVFEDSALAVIDSVKTTLSTDQDFADAKNAVKWCGDVEEAVAAAKKQALSQTQSIDELFSSLDRISAHARETRLKVDKLVKAQELLVKTNIKQKAELALADHIAAINKTLGKVTLPHVVSDFAGAMKNKRTIASLQDAVDTELARAKIDASQAADSIRLNLTSLAELAVDYAFLFNDVQQLVTKTNDDLVTLIKFRISEHQKAEQAKADAKRIAEEQEAQRLAAIKPEPVVEKVATAEPVRATPVQTAAPVAQATKPVTNHVVEQVALQASVTDFEALVKAVAYGQAPITVLLVNWEALDAMVAAQGSTFSMAGVTLGKAAA